MDTQQQPVPVSNAKCAAWSAFREAAYQSLPAIAAVAAILISGPTASLATRLFGVVDRPLSSVLATTADGSESHRGEPILPISRPAGVDIDKSALGQMLFHDPGLSSSRTVSCASCHSIRDGGDDGKQVSQGVGDASGDMNSPTVLNASLNFRQFWDGRVETLEDQVGGPIHNPLEMGSNWEAVINYLNSDDAYIAWFQRVFNDDVTATNVASAIAEYERTLVTPGSPFDHWLKGDDESLTDLQKHGYRVFKDSGCISCHTGANVGGTMFQPLGVMIDFFAKEEALDRHLGRYRVTGLEQDRHVFKVPGLRNVSRTAPYFHDGSAETLPEAVRAMFKHQLGMPAEEEDVKAVCAFLQSLESDVERETP